MREAEHVSLRNVWVDAEMGIPDISERLDVRV